MKKNEVIYDENLRNDVSEFEKRLIELINGAEPKTPDEIEMLKEIQEAKKNGQIIDIPGM
jgi:hypothetical protein